MSDMSLLRSPRMGTSQCTAQPHVSRSKRAIPGGSHVPCQGDAEPDVGCRAPLARLPLRSWAFARERGLSTPGEGKGRWRRRRWRCGPGWRGAVVEAGGEGVGVAYGVLDVAQGDACVEGGGGERLLRFFGSAPCRGLARYNHLLHCRYDRSGHLMELEPVHPLSGGNAVHLAGQATFVSTADRNLLAESWEAGLLSERMTGVMGWLRGTVEWLQPPASALPNDGFVREPPVFARRAAIPFGRSSGTGCFVDLFMYDHDYGTQGLVTVTSAGLGSTGHRKYFASALRALEAVPGTQIQS